MIRRNPIASALGLLLALGLVGELTLLLSGWRILTGELYAPASEGVVGYYSSPPREAYFVCTYFTGRKQVVKELYASFVDECPFIDKP